MMLGVSGMCILVCLSVRVEGGKPLHREGDSADFLPLHDPQADPGRVVHRGVDIINGEMTILFGAVRLPLGRDAEDAVRFLQLLLAGGVADTAGILLLLVWTAGFLPAFLEPNAAAVLLAKPMPRGWLLAGKYLGVLAFVGAQATLFVGGTWLALGLRTGVWDPRYLGCIPLLLLHFAVFFSMSVLLAVVTRSTVGCIFGSMVFWFLCWGMNYGRHAILVLPQHDPLSPLLLWLVETGYWILPKPADFGLLLVDILRAEHFFALPPVLKTAQAQSGFQPELSVLSSLLFSAVLLIIAAREFAAADY